jgi:hypothetical protein
MVKLAYVPHGEKDIYKYYGNPYLDTFLETQMDNYLSPFPLRLSWRPLVTVREISAHRLAGPAMVDALQEIMGIGGEKYLAESRINYFGGTRNLRNKTNSDQLSTHAWGIAIDIAVPLGPYGKAPAVPAFVVEAFTRRGFEWGGRWKVPDGMHFQACTGY